MLNLDQKGQEEVLMGFAGSVVFSERIKKK